MDKNAKDQQDEDAQTEDKQNHVNKQYPDPATDTSDLDTEGSGALVNEETNEVSGDSASPVTKPSVLPKAFVLLCLILLVAVAYLYYLHWQSAKNQTNTSVSQTQFQQLQDQQKTLSAELTHIQADVQGFNQQTKELSQLKTQMNDLSNQVSQVSNTDNSDPKNPNLTNQLNDLATKITQLQEQISVQNQTINNLKSDAVVNDDVSGVENTDRIQFAAEILNATPAQIEINAATRVLLSTDMLLSTQRLPQAITQLENYLTVSTLPATDKNKLLRLLNLLQQVNQPNTEQIEQQLMAVNQQVTDLSLTTEKQPPGELAWYEKFISVKKINTESTISSSAELVQFKTELGRYLYQAKLFLMLKDQSGWESSLQAAKNLVNQQTPKNQNLVKAIANLSQQNIVAQLPDTIDVPAVIEQLKGLR